MSFSSDDQGKVIATGIEVIGHKTVHEQAVNREQQAVFLITDVADPDSIAAYGNPFEKPISIGQYVLWDMSYAMPVVKSQTHITKSFFVFFKLQIASI